MKTCVEREYRLTLLCRAMRPTRSHHARMSCGSMPRTCSSSMPRRQPADTMRDLPDIGAWRRCVSLWSSKRTRLGGKGAVERAAAGTCPADLPPRRTNHLACSSCGGNNLSVDFHVASQSGRAHWSRSVIRDRRHHFLKSQPQRSSKAHVASPRALSRPS